ncbi:hypothetical protein FB550_12081 [Neobacillus bataviensis]|uniref:Uncharacterized protein n=1 Tax=Neobacillus bataviensis TaxID=220685 RepID=A0A561CLZ4_9BACI|nr:hypothetical protein [Neobacillus bataviensis]TWD92269.1 hypothetical protein FB550_12081 [Neobacillus bataviensis]
MKKRKCKCSCENELTRVEMQRIQQILRKLSKLDEDDIEEILPDDCFMLGDLICCRVDGRIICIE